MEIFLKVKVYKSKVYANKCQNINKICSFLLEFVNCFSKNRKSEDTTSQG